MSTAKRREPIPPPSRPTRLRERIAARAAHEPAWAAARSLARRYLPHRPLATSVSAAGDHAIVIGSGIAGLFAARVLADRFDRVTMLERDTIPDGPEVRKKTPQAPHSHVFGARGYEILTELFPGVDRDLAAAGAPTLDYMRDCRAYVDGWMPQFTSGLQIRISTRMLLESRMRSHLLDSHPNITVRSGFRVSDYLYKVESHRITGVREQSGEEVHADLVVDAAGMGSRTPQWLSAHGYQAPRQKRVDMRGGVASCVFRPPPDRSHDWVMLTVKPTRQNRRSVSLMQIEHGLWRVTMMGWGGLRPARDLPNLYEFARSASDPAVYDAIRDAEPVSPIYYYGSCFSRWVCYHEMSRFPDGLAVLGDAVFHANSEHAQGMTFCARAAVELGAFLDQLPAPVAAVAGSSLAFQRQLGRLYSPYWTWNTAIERSVPNIIAHDFELTTRALHRYYDAVRGQLLTDRSLQLVIAKVHQGDLHPASLFSPAVMWRVARGMLHDRAMRFQGDV